MAYQLEMEYDEAQRVCDVIDGFWDLDDYRNWVAHNLETDQILTTPIGRSRRFPIVTDENWHRCFNQACNFYIQSPASDINLLLIKKITEETDPEDVHPLFSIHDSGELEIREDKVDELVPVMVDILESEPGKIFGKTDVPFKVDYRIGTHWTAE